MVDNNCIIEGNVKFRDGKKWKSRWCVMRKLSPVADCLHLQLYGDSKDRYKQGQTKASLSLQHFLGVESGFTLDKESNTIAIICQDLTVVLAFDTRERLIQWQVKISNNLGEDQQFLILISTAPSKAKLATGPAHLHVQDRRFCLTVGVPPRLVGIWEIAHLRRYGVVEGRFCFEGGSRCGRGEGLHVLVTDQGEDIVRTLQLAAEGKLTTRKRPPVESNGNGTGNGSSSPRRQFSRSETRASDFFPSAVYATSHHTAQYEDHCDGCGKNNESSPCWSSTESRHQTSVGFTTLHQTELDADYSCRDTVSVSELAEQPGEWRSCSLARQSAAGLERCASCISKLGTISKSSTSGTTTLRSPAPTANNSASHLPPRAFDRLSLSSYSSSSHDSDYSGSQHPAPPSECLCSAVPQPQSQPQNQTQPQPGKSANPPVQSVHSASPSPTSLPPRPVKPSTVNTATTTTTTTTPSSAKKPKKPPMPLPIDEKSSSCTCSQRNQPGNRNSSGSAGPYENYDVPKTILGHHMSLEPSPQAAGDQYYDTPRKIKECLALPKSYPNYDTPHVPQPLVLQQCGCPAKLQQAQSPRSSSACPCHNVMSWAGFVLPYCRRGAGIEATGVAVHPVKLSGEGKMPVVNASGEIAIYASANRSHEAGARANGEGGESCECATSGKSYASSNYENVGPVIDTQPESSKRRAANYANLDFTESLEHYENSRDVIAKTGMSREEIAGMEELMVIEGARTTGEATRDEEEEEERREKVCAKCGHAKDAATDSVGFTTLGTDYLIMDPEKQTPRKPFPGYLPMQPAHNACSREILSRICGGVKSSSNPTLFGSSTPEATRKRSDSEFRVPGSAMLSSPYLRRRLIDPTAGGEATGMLWRKRSYSAESAHYLDEPNPGFSSSLAIHKCSSEADKSALTTHCEKYLSSAGKDHDRHPSPCANSELKMGQEGGDAAATAAAQPFAIKIRRSSSVPSKTGHNRDSSSSNDSGVSTGSLSHRTAEFVEFELSLAPISSSRKQNILTVCRKSPPPATICFHGSLPRKSKSSDPLRELSFQFQKIKVPTKSSSTEGDVSTCLPKSAKGGGGFGSPGEANGAPYIDSRSTSSGTSDMSDYIETLSLSSHSSSDTPDSLRLGGRAGTTTLRPRSGKEYYKIDRSILVEQGRPQLTTTTSTSYANITPVLEKSESPSPGYMSSSPFEQPQPTRDHFLFPEVSATERKD